MAIDINIELKGAKDLDKLLSKLPDMVAKSIQLKAYRKAAKPLINDAKSRVAVSGKKAKTAAYRDFKKGEFTTKLVKHRKGALKRSIGVKPARGKQAILYAGPRIIRASASSGWYAHFVEFGTVKQKAQPFMRPAWDKNRGRTLDTISYVMKQEVRKFVAKNSKRSA